MNQLNFLGESSKALFASTSLRWRVGICRLWNFQTASGRLDQGLQTRHWRKKMMPKRDPKFCQRKVLKNTFTRENSQIFPDFRDYFERFPESASFHHQFLGGYLLVWGFGNPIGSIYGLFAYIIWVIFAVIVGKYDKNMDLMGFEIEFYFILGWLYQKYVFVEFHQLVGISLMGESFGYLACLQGIKQISKWVWVALFSWESKGPTHFLPPFTKGQKFRLEKSIGMHRWKVPEFLRQKGPADFGGLTKGKLKGSLH